MKEQRPTSPSPTQPTQTNALTVTMGDPGGIGPEVLLRALQEVDRTGWPTLYIYCDREHLENLSRALSIPGPTYYEETQPSTGRIEWCDCPINRDDGSRASFPMGELTPQGAKAQVHYIRRALNAIQEGIAGGIVTGPIHKQALHQCQLPYHGHTEWLADFAKTDVTMMLAGPKLRAVPVTCHIPLADVPSTLTADLLLRSLEHTDQTLRLWYGIDAPKIAVCGLNPHAGDGGMMGTEDDDLIAPTLEKAKELGLNVSGPHPGDTVFYFAYQGAYDAVVAMYHDQALAPLKLAHFDDAINLTMGLPFIRTSVDHGTAYDIAGKGKANAKSMVEALSVAARMLAKQSPT